MRSFIDKEGQPWTVEVTVGHLMNIKTQLGLNLFDEPETLPESIAKCVEILWVTCMDQAKKLGLSPVDFGHRLTGQVMGTAWEAWIQEYADFFDHQSPALAQFLRGQWDVAKKLDQARAELVKEACLSSSLDSLVSPASIQGDSKAG